MYSRLLNAVNGIAATPAVRRSRFRSSPESFRITSVGVLIVVVQRRR
jgi:hypothetical protein